MSKQLAELSENQQRVLLAELLRKKTTKAKKKPLSFAQERLWFLYQLDPDNTANNPFNAFRLSGRLDAKTLEECFNRVAARHEILRTTFTTVDGKAMQVIVPSLELSLPLIELTGIHASERQAVIERMAAKEAQRPFDLSCGPLVRTTLLHLDDTEHILFLTIHHIVSDGWSAGVLLHEMLTLYKARLAGISASSPLPALPLQYADFAIWQRDWLQGELLENQRTYWRKQLQNLSALELPTDHQRPDLISVRGAAYTRMLNSTLTNQLKSLSQQTGGSLFMVLLAGFAALLYRYTGQTDIAIRTPIANRMRKELETLIGYFSNTLVLRTDLSGEPTFRELLMRVAEVCRGAYECQDIPFEKILEDLHPTQHASGKRGPLFPVMFILQNAPFPLPDIPGLQFESLELDGGLAPFELTLALREVKGGMRCRLNYSADLFEQASMERMVGHFEQLLQSLVASPDQGLASLVERIPAAEIPVMHLKAECITEYAPPRTPLEKTLAEIWKETLKVEKIGIHDNFFELGGNSLLSMLVISQARQSGFEISPKQLFQHRTIAELAKVMDTTLKFPTEQEIITGELGPLAPNQHWFFDQKFLGQHRFNVATLFEAIPPLKLEPALVKEVVRNLIVHHDALRMRFVQDGAEWHQFIVPPDDEISHFCSRSLGVVRAGANAGHRKNN